MELLNYDMEDPEEPQYSGKGLEATRDHLNIGTLDRLFKEYATKVMGGWAGFVSKELRFIFLGKCLSHLDLHSHIFPTEVCISRSSFASRGHHLSRKHGNRPQFRR